MSFFCISLYCLIRGQSLVVPARKEGNSLQPLGTTSSPVPEIIWEGQDLRSAPAAPWRRQGSQCPGGSCTAEPLRKSGNAVCNVGIFPSATLSYLEEPPALWKSSCTFVKCLTERSSDLSRCLLEKQVVLPFEKLSSRLLTQTLSLARC